MKTIVAARTGELRLEDVPREHRDGSNEARVVVVAHNGAESEHLVGFAQKWQATSWTWMFACPRCAAPARVLRLDGAGVLACSRCVPHQSLAQRQHRTRWWRERDGVLVDALVRCARRARRDYAELQMRDIVDRLAANTEARATPVLELATGALAVADEALFRGKK